MSDNGRNGIRVFGACKDLKSLAWEDRMVLGQICSARSNRLPGSSKHAVKVAQEGCSMATIAPRFFEYFYIISARPSMAVTTHRMYIPVANLSPKFVLSLARVSLKWLSINFRLCTSKKFHTAVASCLVFRALQPGPCHERWVFCSTPQLTPPRRTRFACLI
jgi:hypothetical protein